MTIWTKREVGKIVFSFIETKANLESEDKIELLALEPGHSIRVLGDSKILTSKTAWCDYRLESTNPKMKRPIRISVKEAVCAPRATTH